jgi:hypothetical protein
MTRKPRDLTFRKADVMRAYKAAVGAGIPNPRIEVDREGTISIIAQPSENGASDALDDLDRELEEFRARHGQG